MVGLATAGFGAYLLYEHFTKGDTTETEAIINAVSFRFPPGLAVLALGLTIAIVGPIVGHIYLADSPSRAASEKNPPTTGPTWTPTATPSPTVTGTASPMPPPSTSPPIITVAAPLNGTEISGAEGVVISGTAQNLGDSTIWIFDFALDADGKRVFYRNNDIPLEVAEGAWSFIDRPIGGGTSDIGNNFKISIVEASKECTEILRNAKPNPDGDVVFSSLPAGCQQIDQREVRKVRA
ncbi:hypothetical protein [Parafrankia discariae]|uniref:hypothetical protein n=1 Tax=Parafrankia discariae TaxID=365528 RepID=UPI0012B689B8|nr:hypothetical protein [Parafrankia discariae]